MLAEIRGRSQITIPAEIKSKFENATMQNIVLNQNQMYFLKVLLTLELAHRERIMQGSTRTM